MAARLPEPPPSCGMPGTPAPAIAVRGLALSARKRTIFEDVTFDVATGSLAVLAGDSGTGKSAFALMLGGRLPASAGWLSVLDVELPRHAGAVRRRVGLAGNATVAPLDETLTVRHHVTEALRLAGPWWRPGPSREQVHRTITTANDMVAALEAVFRDDGASAPLARARLHAPELVRDASPLARFTLGLVLALVPKPEILVVDDVDQLRTADERRAAWAALLTLECTRRAGGTPLTVVATCQDSRELDDVLASGRLRSLPVRPVAVHLLTAAASLLPTPDPEIR